MEYPSLSRSVLDGDEIRLDVGDVVELVEVGGEDVVELGDLETSADSWDVLGVFGVGEVPEGVRVVVGDVGGVLEGAASVGGWRQGKQHPPMSQYPVELVEEVDLRRDVLEEIDRADDSHRGVLIVVQYLEDVTFEIDVAVEIGGEVGLPNRVVGGTEFDGV